MRLYFLFRKHLLVVGIVFALFSNAFCQDILLEVEKGSGSGRYKAGERIHIKASPPPRGKIFDRWGGEHADIVEDLSRGETVVTIPPLKDLVVPMIEVQNFERGEPGQTVHSTGGRWKKAENEWTIQKSEGAGHIGGKVAEKGPGRSVMKYFFGDNIKNPFRENDELMVLRLKMRVKKMGKSIRVGSEVTIEQLHGPSFGMIGNAKTSSLHFFIIPYEHPHNGAIQVSDMPLILGQWYDIELRITPSKKYLWSQVRGSLYYRLSGHRKWREVKGAQNILLGFNVYSNLIDANVWRVRSFGDGVAQMDDLSFGKISNGVKKNVKLKVKAIYKINEKQQGVQLSPRHLKITSYNSSAGTFVENAFNGIGLKGKNHDGQRSHMWLSKTYSNGQFKGGWIKVDLGGVYHLDHLRVWNFNQVAFQNWGLKGANIYVSLEDPAGNHHFSEKIFNRKGWKKVLSNQEFSLSKGGENVRATDENIELNGVKARFIAFEIKDNMIANDLGMVGLSEVEIYVKKESNFNQIKIAQALDKAPYLSFVAGSFVNIRAPSPAQGKTFYSWLGDTHYLEDPKSFATSLTMPNLDISLVPYYKNINLTRKLDKLNGKKLKITSFEDNGTSPARNAFNGVGRYGLDLHDHRRESGWFSQKSKIIGQWIKIDFGGVYHLDHLRVWNYYRPGLKNLGLSQADFYVALTDPGVNFNHSKKPFDNTNWALIAENQQFSIANSGSPSDEKMSLNGVRARFMGIKMKKSYSGDNRVGIAEIEFFVRSARDFSKEESDGILDRSISKELNDKKLLSQLNGAINASDFTGKHKVDLFPKGITVSELGASQTIYARLTSPPTDKVTVVLKNSKKNLVRLTPDRFVFTPHNWNELQTIKMTGMKGGEEKKNFKYEMIVSKAKSRDRNYHGKKSPRIVVSYLKDYGSRGFKLYDFIKSQGRPQDLSPFGLKSNIFFLSDIHESFKQNEAKNSENFLAMVGHQLKNIEIFTFPDAKSYVFQKETSLRIKVLMAKREFSRHLKYGFYGGIPSHSYSSQTFEKKFDYDWGEKNNLLQPLADVSDIFFVRLKTYYAKDIKRWATYAMANLNEAKRLAQGRPIYVLLSPDYISLEHYYSVDSSLVPGVFWREQLKILKGEKIDGVIIERKSITEWNLEDPWWQETMVFLEKNK